jgi:hypothetical protein
MVDLIARLVISIRMHLAPYTAAKTMHLCVAFTGLAVCLTPSLVGQSDPQGSGREVTVRVPFIGCRSDGQLGPIAAPKEVEKVVRTEASVAQRLAYYKDANTSGVLAPRGWYCFGTYGSGGSTLFVAPQPLDENDFFSTPWSGIIGPVIQFIERGGGTSGRFDVARAIARVFPVQTAFARGVIEEGFLPASEFPFGPYPRDELIIRSDRIVEYQTPAHSEGLGTMGGIGIGDEAISGFVMLQGQTPDLLLLAVRLPPGMDYLASYITRESERGNPGTASKK